MEGRGAPVDRAPVGRRLCSGVPHAVEVTKLGRRESDHVHLSFLSAAAAAAAGRYVRSTAAAAAAAMTLGPGANSINT